MAPADHDVVLAVVIEVLVVVEVVADSGCCCSTWTTQPKVCRMLGARSSNGFKTRRSKVTTWDKFMTQAEDDVCLRLSHKGAISVASLSSSLL